MRFADSRRASQNHVTGFMYETQRAQLANLPFVKGRLKAEIKLIEVFHKWQVSQLKPSPQITTTSRLDFTTE